MGTPTGCPYGLGALPSPLMHPLRGCIWGQGPKGPPCPHYRATEGGPLKNKNKYIRGVHMGERWGTHLDLI